MLGSLVARPAAAQRDLSVPSPGHPESITEEMMRVTNPPTDEQCLTYETAPGSGHKFNFEWQSCAAATGDVSDVGNCVTGACFTGSSGTMLTSTTGEILDLGTDATFIFQRNTAGAVTLQGKDDASPADTIYDTTGAGNITVGSGDVLTITLTTDGTGNGEVVVPDNSINLTTGAGQEVTGILPPANGGTGLDTSGSTGLLRVITGTWSAAGTSSDVRGAVSDETGTGFMVFSTAPTFDGDPKVGLATPDVLFEDTDAVATLTADIQHNCPDLTGVENCEVTMRVLSNDTMTSYLFVDEGVGSNSFNLDLGNSTRTSFISLLADGTGNQELVVPNDSIGPDELDSTTGAYDFSAVTSLAIPSGTNPTVDAAGEIAVDTTATQLIVGASATVFHAGRTGCVAIENLVAGDDSQVFGSFPFAVTVTEVWCHCRGTCTGAVADAFTLEDGDGNAMTHTGGPDCATSGNATVQSVSAANTLVAGEALAFDTAVTPNGTDEYLLCVTYTVTRQ